MEPEQEIAPPQQRWAIWGSASFDYRRHLFSYVLTIILLACAVPPILENWDRFCLQLSASAGWVPTLCLVVLCNLTIRARYLKQLAESLGGVISMRESFCLIGASNLLEFVAMPIAGAAYRGWYLKRAKETPLASYAAGMTAFAVARLVVWGIPATACLVSIGLWRADTGHDLLYLALATLFALGVALIGQRLLRSLAAGRTVRFSRIADQWLQVTTTRRIAVSAGVSMLGCMLLESLGFYVTLRTSNLPIDPLACIGLTACHQLSGILGLTPGGIGFQEAAGVLLSEPLGLAAAEMLIVLVLMRAARTVIAAAIGLPCWWFLPRMS